MQTVKRLWGTPLLLFAITSFMVGMYGGLYDPSFNNYLAQTHHLGAMARSGLELPRELPGFLVVFVLTALLFLADTRIATVAVILVSLGLLGQGFLSPNLAAVVLWMLIWSFGQHLYMSISPVIGLRLSRTGEEGRRLGQLGSLESFGALLGMTTVFVGWRFLHFGFPVIFGLAGALALAAGICLYRINPEKARIRRKLVLKKRYSLYYFICILFGARKQIFLTFAPWVLIKIFHAGVPTFALLLFIATTLNLGVRPLVGRAVDAFGQKPVIAAESIMLIIICSFYGLAPGLFVSHIAMFIVMACYIIDQLLFSVGIARVTFLHRIAETPEDIAPTISMGQTLDHVVSMLIPIAGGLLWVNFGYMWVFLAGGVLACLNLGAAFLIPNRVPVSADPA